MATFKQIAADARTIASEMNFTDPNDTEISRFGNEALQKVGKLLQGIDPRLYGQIAVLNVAVGAGNAVYDSAGTYSLSAKTVGTTGSLTSVTKGGIMLAYGNTGSVEELGFAYVTGKTSVLSLDRDIMNGLGDPTVEFKFAAVSPASTGELTLTLSEDIADIAMVTGVLSGPIVPCDIDKYLGFDANPNYDNSAGYFQQGRILQVIPGAGLTGGVGVVFVFYRRRPRVISAMTDTVDLPIKYHQILRDEIARVLVIRRGKVSPPPEIADPLAPLMAQMQANWKTVTDAQKAK